MSRSALGPVCLLGLPWDGGSSYLFGASLAPARIREALASPSRNRFSELGVEVDANNLRDVGDACLDVDSPRTVMRNFVECALDRGERPLILGGDHSITHPVLEAIGPRHRDLTLLQFDAHSDLYDTFLGNPHSHACPFARIMESGLVKRLVQVGIRTLEPRQRKQVERFGVEVVEARSLRPFRVSGPLYISCDLDVLDPAFAPGVSHHEPGGLSTRQLLDLIQGIDASIIGADVVELNPHRDVNGMTAMVAAKIVSEIAAKMILG